MKISLRRCNLSAYKELSQDYHIILMSVRKNVAYANKWLPKENVIIYEGPDDKKIIIFLLYCQTK